MKPIYLILLWGVVAWSILMGMHYFYDGGKQLIRELESPINISAS